MIFLKCLQPLSKEMAWELFCKQAFVFELLELSLEIVRRCHGLPLVVKAIADFLLSTKMNVVTEWEMLLNHLNEGFRENPRLNSIVSTIFPAEF